jgi:hypothetical protein
MRHADIREGAVEPASLYEREMDENARQQDEQDVQNGVGHFGRAERQLFEHELLQEVVIGMGYLDQDGPSADDQWDGDAHWEMEESATESPPPFIQVDVTEPVLGTEQAILGRLSSMSLMAAVTAGGMRLCISPCHARD